MHGMAPRRECGARDALGSVRVLGVLVGPGVLGQIELAIKEFSVNLGKPFLCGPPSLGEGRR